MPPDRQCASSRLYQRINDWIESIVVAFTALVVAVIVLCRSLSVVTRLLTGEGYSFLAETAPQLVPLGGVPDGGSPAAP